MHGIENSYTLVDNKPTVSIITKHEWSKYISLKTEAARMYQKIRLNLGFLPKKTNLTLNIKTKTG